MHSWTCSIWSIWWAWTCVWYITVFGGHVFSHGIYLVLRLAWTSVWTYLFYDISIWKVMYLFLSADISKTYLLCVGYVVYLFFLCFLYNPTIYYLLLEVGGYWMDGGNHLCIHRSNSVFLVCIDGLYKSLIDISYSYAFIDASNLYITFWYMQVFRGVSLAVSSQIICDNSMYFVIVKRGRLLAQRPLALVLMITKYMLFVSNNFV